MDFLVPFVFSLCFGGVGIVLLARSVPAQERGWIIRMLFIALGLRLAAATLFALFPETRYFHEDASGYEWWGMAIAKGWHDQGPMLDFTQRMGQNYGYYYVAAAVYYVLPFQAAAAMLNCVFGTITVFCVYRLAREHFHPLVARRAALLTSILPSMVLWSAVALKDPVVSLLIVVALLGCMRLKRGVSVLALIATVLPILALQPIRFYMVYFVGFSVVVSLFLERGMRSLGGVYKQLAVVGAILALFAVVGLAGRASKGTSVLSLERVSSFRHGMATSAQSGFAEDADVSTPGRALLFLPIGMANLLLSPFPWQMGSLRALLAAPETVYWWFLMPSMVRGMRFVLRKRWRELSPLLIFAGTLTMAYSLVHGNIGSGFRQRAQIFVILFIFVAVGVLQQRCRRAGIDENELLMK